MYSRRGIAWLAVFALAMVGALILDTDTATTDDQLNYLSLLAVLVFTMIFWVIATIVGDNKRNTSKHPK